MKMYKIGLIWTNVSRRPYEALFFFVQKERDELRGLPISLALTFRAFEALALPVAHQRSQPT